MKLEKKNIYILATGGTIAGTGASGKETGYRPGSIGVDELIKSVPLLSDVANIKGEQILNLNSDDVTFKDWIALSKRINDLAGRCDVDGVVITHGTDTMEETAYFLELTTNVDIPVVLTGSMRPSTSISPDGPMNLYQAVLTAACDEATALPVVVVMDNKILFSRTIQKTSTYSLSTMQSGESGILGVIRDNKVQIIDQFAKNKITVSKEFNVKKMKTIPRVSVVYFNVDASVGLLRYALDNSDGVVIAGAGAGEYSKKYKKLIDKAKVPVVIASRTNSGILMQDSMLSKNSISSIGLNPAKAAVLLRVALAVNPNRDFDDYIRIFETY